MLCFFSAGVFHDTFQSLNVEPAVLYPSLNTFAFDDFRTRKPPKLEGNPKVFTFISVNRFERKKNLDLALEAYGKDHTSRKWILFDVIFFEIQKSSFQNKAKGGFFKFAEQFSKE